MEVVARECKRLGVKLPPSHSHAFDTYRLEFEEKEFAMADKLLCPSEFVARTFLDRGFTKDRIALHRYGFDPSRFKVSSGSLIDADEGPFKMVFMASCEPRKGLHYALDAWLASKACADGIFYICGRYVPGYRELLANKLAHPSIKELGFIDDTAALLQKCHAMVLPTIEEGSALVTYDARACGCVLLVSEAAGAVCEHRKNALVHKPGDVESLREHIDLLASNKELFSQLRSNSLATVHELTWSKAAECLMSAYHECLNENKST
jgi:glycosyltransferase involved in cell wall biosynthesis